MRETMALVRTADSSPTLSPRAHDSRAINETCYELEAGIEATDYRHEWPGAKNWVAREE